MSDDNREDQEETPEGLTTVRPIAPRRPPWSTQMARPILPGEVPAEPRFEEPPPVQEHALVANEAPVVVEQPAATDGEADDQESVVDVAPPAEAYSVSQPVMELVAHEGEPAPQPSTPEPEQAAAPEPQAPAAPEPEPPAAPEPEPPAAPNVPDYPKTMRETLRVVDQAWAAFRAAAERFPLEHMDERLGADGWTRKQMLEHVAAWHDLTADRMVAFINTGEPPPFQGSVDGFNASVARRAIGKTSGEILKDMDATFNRLRRQTARLTDAQLEAHDWWAAYVIAGNTYGHYQEHWADIYTPEAPSNGRARR